MTDSSEDFVKFQLNGLWIRRHVSSHRLKITIIRINIQPIKILLTCTRAKVPYPGAFNPGARRGASFGVSGIGSGLQGEVEDSQGYSKYSMAPPFLKMNF